jgi:hypothetical protein
MVRHILEFSFVPHFLACFIFKLPFISPPSLSSPCLSSRSSATCNCFAFHLSALYLCSHCLSLRSFFSLSYMYTLFCFVPHYFFLVSPYLAYLCLEYPCFLSHVNFALKLVIFFGTSLLYFPFLVTVNFDAFTNPLSLSLSLFFFLLFQVSGFKELSHENSAFIRCFAHPAITPSSIISEVFIPTTSPRYRLI